MPRLLRLVWTTEPKYVVGILVLRIARSLIPLAVLWIGKLIVDEVVHAIGTAGSGAPVDWARLIELLAIELAIALVGEGLARVSSLLESLLGDLFANRTSVELMRHAAMLDLEQFENADMYDKLERARRQTVGRIGLFTLLLATVQDAITLITLGAALAAYVPWLLVLLVVAVLPSLLGETHFASLGYSLLYSWTPERRQLDYLRYIGASDISAKELKLFGLSDFLVDRYDRLSQEFYEANKDLAVRRSLISSLLAVVGTLGYYAAYAVIIYLTVVGHRGPAGRLHDRRAHLSGGVVQAEPGSHSARAALSVAGVRAESLSGRPLQLSGDRAKNPAESRRAAASESHSGGASCSREWDSVTPAPSSGRCEGSTFRSRRASGWRWSGRTAPGKPRSSSCSPGSTTRARGASCSTAWI